MTARERLHAALKECVAEDATSCSAEMWPYVARWMQQCRLEQAMADIQASVRKGQTQDALDALDRLHEWYQWCMQRGCQPYAHSLEDGLIVKRDLITAPEPEEDGKPEESRRTWVN